jgi:prepilin-type N-terminal cleavage/methylation domain-containing protein
MTSQKKGKKAGFTLIELMIVIAIIAILAAILVPNFIRARAQGLLTSCKSNLKNSATALEMYSTDNAGRYPVSGNVGATGNLTPAYLKSAPTCPSNSGSYAMTSATNPDAFSIVCSGSQHTGAGITTANYPQYFNTSGLVER